MSSTLLRASIKRCGRRNHVRYAATTAKAKPPGDISSVFPSLSGVEFVPLPERFTDLQKGLINGHESDIVDAWHRLLSDLEKETKEIQRLGHNIVPTADFEKDIGVDPLTNIPYFKSAELVQEIKKRGTVVIRNVVPRDEARNYKYMAEEYVKANPSVVGFPKDNISVYELYWSKSQLRARSHPNMLKAQIALMSLWQSVGEASELACQIPLMYADRLRIRYPGDSQFALGPHIDGGSIERWEDPEYAKVYKSIFDGNWEDYDAWDYRHRVNAITDMYGAGGACSMIRMFQGWLSISSTGVGEGSLRVYPLIKQATAYTILRPFFDVTNAQSFVAPSNSFPNTALGAGQELNSMTHPHLLLDSCMVNVPNVEPGDYVAWHCDGIHAVDKEHKGKEDSSVLYIPAVPLTKPNAQYLVRQRAAFQSLSPPPDFPDAGGVGESKFVGHGTEEDFMCEAGLQAAGFGSKPWDVNDAHDDVQRKLIAECNKIVFE
ncbi:hypothetical protein V1511DRAFT_499108 [Dipodascopsis uninucleata]